VHVQKSFIKWENIFNLNAISKLQVMFHPVEPNDVIRN
jgi:hypothetical protein